MNEQPVLHDERTAAVAGVSARLAYLVLYFGVLIIAVVRTMVFRQICVDLLGVIFLSSVVGLVYQRVKRAQVIPWRWILWFALGGGVLGLAMSLLRHYF